MPRSQIAYHPLISETVLLGPFDGEMDARSMAFILFRKSDVSH